MDKIIPFEKEIKFKTMLSEITAISLDHSLKINDNNTIGGDFIIGGKYKMTEASQLEEDFSFKLPVEITIDDHYDVKDSKLSIDDFNYEIINDEALKVNIDVLLSDLKEKIKEEKEDNSAELLRLEQELTEIEQRKTEEEEDNVEMLDSSDIKELKEKEVSEKDTSIEDKMLTNKLEKTSTIEEKDTEETVNSIFNNFSDENDTFVTYKVYIVREDDTIEKIMDKYKVTEEEISNYNNLNEFKTNMKLIIPYNENS